MVQTWKKRKTTLSQIAFRLPSLLEKMVYMFLIFGLASMVWNFLDPAAMMKMLLRRTREENKKKKISSVCTYEDYSPSTICWLQIKVLQKKKKVTVFQKITKEIASVCWHMRESVCDWGLWLRDNPILSTMAIVIMYQSVWPKCLEGRRSALRHSKCCSTGPYTWTHLHSKNTVTGQGGLRYNREGRERREASPLVLLRS